MCKKFNNFSFLPSTLSVLNTIHNFFFRIVFCEFQTILWIEWGVSCIWYRCGPLVSWRKRDIQTLAPLKSLNLMKKWNFKNIWLLFGKFCPYQLISRGKTTKIQKRNVRIHPNCFEPRQLPNYTMKNRSTSLETVIEVQLLYFFKINLFRNSFRLLFIKFSLSMRNHVNHIWRIEVNCLWRFYSIWLLCNFNEHKFYRCLRIQQQNCS